MLKYGRNIIVNGLAFGVLMTAAVAPAAAPAGQEPVTPPDTATLAATAQVADSTPLQQELQALRAREQSVVADLAARWAQEPTATRRLELQRAIEGAKRDGRLAQLAAQARHARLAGDAEVVARIEAAIAALSPTRPATP